MSESSLYFKQRLKGADVDLDADLIGVAHPKGGTTDELAMSLRELSKALGGSTSAPLNIQGPPGVFINFKNPAGDNLGEMGFGYDVDNQTIFIGKDAAKVSREGQWGFIAIGAYALSNQTDNQAYWSVGIGQNAWRASTQANLCTGVGMGVGASLVGFISRNVAIGNGALAGVVATPVSPHWSTAVGFGAVGSGGSGGNTGCGSYTLLNTVAGQNNAALGSGAGQNNVSGFYHTCLGYGSGPSTGALTNTISVGANIAVAVSNTAIIGDATVTDAYFGSVTGASKLHGKGDAIVFPAADPHIVGAGYWAGAVWTRSAG